MSGRSKRAVAPPKRFGEQASAAELAALGLGDDVFRETEHVEDDDKKKAKTGPKPGAKAKKAAAAAPAEAGAGAGKEDAAQKPAAKKGPQVGEKRKRPDDE
jgi:hypothetical protein